ncbi:MAG: hypothetical protein OEY37_00700 [Gammaproteobacteria bacterium]|nr:hypothetical protein [Gammaproteobacteria bacterium]
MRTAITEQTATTGNASPNTLRDFLPWRVVLPACQLRYGFGDAFPVLMTGTMSGRWTVTGRRLRDDRDA